MPLDAQKAQQRAQKMREAGFTLLPLPKDMALITVSGGHMLSLPHKGDAIDLYCNDENDFTSEQTGVWRSGYVALSDVRKGVAGGAYDGEDVFWVGKVADNPSRGVHDALKGDEWPADCVRLSEQDGAQDE